MWHTPSSWQVALAIWVALAVDRRLGEPPVTVHPVVWMGKALAWLGQRISPAAPVASLGFDGLAWASGFVGWWLLAVVCTTAGWVLSELVFSFALHPVLQALLLGLLLKPLFAWRMLLDEVRAVEEALQQGLTAGRARLAWLVSRDVSQLSTEQVRESAIESLAENLNDSVVAPLFWFALAGLPGAALFRLANTADAMWGYPAERNGRVWTWAGQWAARADDVLGWVPARLTALLLWPAALSPTGWFANAKRLRAEAHKTPSPNSGWPMAAVALRLNIRLAKPGVYTLNGGSATPGASDLERSLVLGRKMHLALSCICITAILFEVALAQ